MATGAENDRLHDELLALLCESRLAASQGVGQLVK
jgi:hypothetical protein